MTDSRRRGGTAQKAARQVAEPWLTYPLQKPIKTGRDEDSITELVFREPQGADTIAIGGNFVILDIASDPVLIKHDYKLLALTISRLCAMPPAFVGQITVGDLAAIATLLSPFFIPTGGVPPSPTL